MAKKKEPLIVKGRTAKPNRSFSRWPVDIIIPFHGQYDKVTKLIESIMTFTLHPHIITLVDDCSPNEDYLSKHLKKAPVRTIRTEEQSGFGGCLNLGYQNSEAPWVVFMHSDVAIENAHWLGNLGQSLQNLKKVGVKMVSAKTDNPGDRSFLKAKKGEETDKRDTLLEGDVLESYLPFYCVMFHRELISRIGPLKEYPYAWYEDLEFACRMQKYGFHQGISGTSWVHHEGGATIEDLCKRKPEIKEIMENNRDLCIADIKMLNNP
jgi:GT2 family glycosyltransferase